MTVASVAQQWQASGFSTIPILANATKRPAVRWTEFMARIPNLGEIDEWWGNGRGLGLALIMGKVSGNVEMLELEARATDAESLLAIDNACDEAGIGYVWDMLQGINGYSEHSPSGGLHYIYRISDHDVPGNEKVARRPANDDELTENPADKIKVLAETRGEGGYVIVAPSPGGCHPSGEPWSPVLGVPGLVPTINWEERCKFHEAVTRALDVPLAARVDVQIPTSHQLVVTDRGSDSADRPGDDFEAQTDWDSPLLLGGAGWTRGRSSDGSTQWTRPGKDPRDGPSATTGRDSQRDRLWVFSTSTELPSYEPLTKFHVYSLLHHGGDHAAAARELRRLGFGGSSSGIPAVADFEAEGYIEKESSGSFKLDDVGGRERLAEFVDGNFVWAQEMKEWFRWNGSAWECCSDGALERAYDVMTSKLLDDPDPAVVKWATRARSGPRATYIQKHMASVEGISHPGSDFDKDAGLLNLRNGVMDLRTQTVTPHRRELMMTKMANASYDPQATCPNFESFTKLAIPDDATRAYVQRAVGYSMLGDTDQRAVFLVWGPSGTGKTQFLETLRHVFGDYGCTASTQAFMATSAKGPTADVHRLRGRRFVATSETADNLRFDEETVKRLTGGDVMSTRGMYQEEQEWRPQCSIWIATNHKPKFSSDDDAIWRRSKLLPFTTRFGSEGGPEEIFGYARKFMFAEADGILNWMLAGLADFLANGLQEPQEVQDQTTLHRQEVDAVATFLQDSVTDGVLKLSPDVHMASVELFNMYADWCRQAGERPFGRRRFTNRVLSNLQGIVATNTIGGRAGFTGITRTARLGLAGSLMPVHEDP